MVHRLRSGNAVMSSSDRSSALAGRDRRGGTLIGGGGDLVLFVSLWVGDGSGGGPRGDWGLAVHGRAIAVGGHGTGTSEDPGR